MNWRRPLTKREIILLLAGLIVLCGVLYYFLFYSRVEAKIQSYDTSSIESEIQVEEARSKKIKQMQKDVDSAKGRNVGVVATYDNLSNEMNEMNDIFQGAVVYNFNFQTPVASGDTVRRNLTVEFVASSYSQALDMIRQIYSGEYRNQIMSIQLAPSTDNTSDSLLNGMTSGSVNLTFYETLNGATTKDGLITEKDSDDGNSSSDSGSTDSPVK